MEKDVLFITHEVGNYNDWRHGFDTHNAARESAGIKLQSVFTAADNPNKVSAMFDIENMENAQKFINDPGLKEAMQKAGVTSPPEIRFMKKR